ncbi:Na+/H+ antiporter NhaC family protein [Synergistes jonesii]|uniref:Sodium:proton antiporter n=1 Tax=Synergistes jonesii TaxID=2754 RepID=A0A073IRL4_9BACT|nr:Na+/H+ antiporter NhaC family protein [Synergistes jonesii]KEJ92988.1 sodium:proton antiporter [Synergistes jonesii]OFB62532.1 sodium:proton antiporter [Synergistes jonesii]OFB64546.1 sodium:proton antiporter [Synergistes jonesii]OFB65746.1 sodium:proton antiporter [Synergistes jonesii]OFB75684.1 sodium:proton antiporter [Synergistes jonesii]
MLLLNPVVISVIVMIGLCLVNLNIVLALLFAAIAGGLAAGMSIPDTMGVLINGMGGNSEMALAYFLLGSFAVAINKTGLASVACKKIAGLVGERKMLLMFLLAFIACISGTVVPVHIAFIPILIPPLLFLFNRLKADRRQAACALAFGLKCPYITLPIGYGLIFQGIIAAEMGRNGVEIAKGSVPAFTWIIGIGMIIGLLIALFVSYNRPRNYEDRPIIGGTNEDIPDVFTKTHYLTMVAVAAAFAAQLWSGSMPLGALVALTVMIVTGVLKLKDIDDTFLGGLEIMGLIAFVMLIAAGYGNVLRETKSVEHLVNGVVGMVGGSRFWGALLMLAVGLLVTMGIGTSFGTVPVIAAIYCPLAIQLGFSAGATACLIAAAGALGDAGSPASDTTLGPTAGLNADGQHNHIWDTCVPTFIHYNIPIFIAAMIGALMIY